MKCNIIQDLLPLYVDNICSEDTKELVEEHVAGCKKCRQTLEQMEREICKKQTVDIHEREILEQGKKNLMKEGENRYSKIILVVDLLMNASIALFIFFIDDLYLFPIWGFFGILLICDVVLLTRYIRNIKKRQTRSLDIMDGVVKGFFGVKIILILVLIICITIIAIHHGPEGIVEFAGNIVDFLSLMWENNPIR